MSDATHDVRLWRTREWGLDWVGCQHGVPKSGTNPVRICWECFDDSLRTRIASLEAENEELKLVVPIIGKYLEDRDCGYDALASDDWDLLKEWFAKNDAAKRADGSEGG